MEITDGDLRERGRCGMSDRQESIADIIAEMRRGTRLPDYWRSCDVNKILQYHADRIEEAYKRKMSKIVSKNGADFGQLGNAAKLREALVAAKKFVDGVGKAALIGEVDAETICLCAANLSGRIAAALAAPPRNCDMYDKEEVRMAYHLHGDGLMTMQAVVDWLFSPRKEASRES